MARTNHDTTRIATKATKLTDLDTAMSDLLQALGPVDESLLMVTELVEAWGDLSFDDRRYLGTAFPRLVNVLLRVEDHLR